MAEEQITPEEIASQLAGMVDLLDQAQKPALEELAALQEKRAERFQRLEKRIASSLPADDPRRQAVRAAGARASLLRRGWQEDARRAEKVPRIKPDEWMVYGQVKDARGNPVSNAQVRLAAKDPQVQELLGSTATDESGDFTLVYPESIRARLGEKAPELFIQVVDRRGRELFLSDVALTVTPGRAEFFLIVLAEKPSTKKARTKA